MSLYMLLAEHISCSIAVSKDKYDQQDTKAFQPHCCNWNCQRQSIHAHFWQEASLEAGVNFPFAVPISRPRASNTCLIRPLSVIYHIVKSVLGLCSKWVPKNLAELTSFSRSTPYPSHFIPGILDHWLKRWQCFLNHKKAGFNGQCRLS